MCVWNFKLSKSKKHLNINLLSYFLQKLLQHFKLITQILEQVFNSFSFKNQYNHCFSTVPNWRLDFDTRFEGHEFETHQDRTNSSARSSSTYPVQIWLGAVVALQILHQNLFKMPFSSQCWYHQLCQKSFAVLVLQIHWLFDFHVKARHSRSALEDYPNSLASDLLQAWTQTRLKPTDLVSLLFKLRLHFYFFQLTNDFRPKELKIETKISLKVRLDRWQAINIFRRLRTT